jgi:hypothetical protein
MPSNNPPPVTQIHLLNQNPNRSQSQSQSHKKTTHTSRHLKLKPQRVVFREWEEWHTTDILAGDAPLICTDDYSVFSLGSEKEKRYFTFLKGAGTYDTY